jgi:hypothetical protein
MSAHVVLKVAASSRVDMVWLPSDAKMRRSDLVVTFWPTTNGLAVVSFKYSETTAFSKEAPVLSNAATLASLVVPASLESQHCEYFPACDHKQPWKSYRLDHMIMLELPALLGATKWEGDILWLKPAVLNLAVVLSMSSSGTGTPAGPASAASILPNRSGIDGPPHEVTARATDRARTSDRLPHVYKVVHGAECVVEC